MIMNYSTGSIVSFAPDTSGWTIRVGAQGRNAWEGHRALPVAGWAVVTTEQGNEIQPVIVHERHLITASQWHSLPEHTARSGFAVTRFELCQPDEEV